MPTASRRPRRTVGIPVPDFVGIGAQRAGTTWWFAELRKHPALNLAPEMRKELHFFDTFPDRPLTEQHIARYHRWFPRPVGGITGEWTPKYVYEPWVVPMVARAAPDAGILLLLRDPIDRFRSGLQFRLDRGFSYNEAVLDAFHRGLYSGQVARLFEHIRRERVLVLLYEELRADPLEQRARTADFIGLDPDRFPHPVDARSPTARPEDDNVTAVLLAELGARYREDIERLRLLLPEVDFGRWQSAHRT